MSDKNENRKGILPIHFGKDTLILRSPVTDILLPEIWHFGPEHKLALLGRNKEMSASVGTTLDYVRFTCLWCRLCFEIDWAPGMPLEKVAEKIRNTISSQAHD